MLKVLPTHFRLCLFNYITNRFSEALIGLTQHTGVLFKGKRMSNFSQKIIDEPPPNVLKIDVMKTFLSWNYSYVTDNSTKYCFYSFTD